MDTGIYLYWRSEEARKKANDPIAQYIRRQEQDERNWDPSRNHGPGCQCADCMWPEEETEPCSPSAD